MRTAGEVLTPVLLDDIVKRLARMEELLLQNLPGGDLSGDLITVYDTSPYPYMRAEAFYSASVFNKGPSTIRVWSNRKDKAAPAELDTGEKVDVTSKRGKTRTIYLALKNAGDPASVVKLAFLS